MTNLPVAVGHSLHVSQKATSISQTSFSWLFLLFNLPAKHVERTG